MSAGAGLYENPSADKFEPPPSSRPPEAPSTKPERSRALAGTAFLLVIAREGLRFAHFHVSGYAWLAPLALLVLSVASFAVDRKRRAEIGRDNPYTPAEHVTR
ncbi:MAG: hypothetical protein ACRD1V_16420 [Vicinamibacterales bacterium]